MDYKERLRLAKEALESGSYDKDTIEYIFPELKESEDEKIRKEIINYFKCQSRDEPSRKDIHNKWIAWLEKQGKNNMGISEATKQKLEDNLNKALEKETPESWNEFLDGQGEQKPAWSEEDERNFGIIYGIIYNSCNAEDASRLIEWLKSFKDRVQPQPNQEWSEEDRITRNVLIKLVEKLYESSIYELDKNRLLDWLKSLKPQNTWKPSDGQMVAINTAINVLGKGTLNGKQLIELYQDLKKLKG